MQSKERKWRWIGYALRKPYGATEKRVLDWNPQGNRRRGHPKKTLQRTVEEEALFAGKSWKEVKGLAKNQTSWRCFISVLCSSEN